MPIAHACPRCDYDLSGETSRWLESCPICGRCPECGLDFLWSHVCIPERFLLQGFVEHANGFRRIFTWAWRTWSWTLLPWRFWNRVEMHHKQRVGRLLTYLAIVILLPHLIGAIAILAAESITASVRLRSGWAWLSDLTYPIAYLNGPWSSVPSVQWTFSAWPTQGIWLTVGALGLPILLGLMPISLRRAKVRSAHVLRACVYSASVPGIFFAMTALLTLLSISLLGLGYNARMWEYFHAFQRATYNVFFTYAGLWIALWWLLALTRGWKLRSGWAVWLSILCIAILMAVAIGGFEIGLFGRIYRF